VKVEVDRRGWNDGDLRWRRWSSITAMVFRRGGSPVAVQRLGRSLRGARWFDGAPWRGLGWSKRQIPTADRGGSGEVDGDGDAPAINVGEGPAHEHR
jgi:hypothetical protein